MANASVGDTGRISRRGLMQIGLGLGIAMSTYGCVPLPPTTIATIGDSIGAITIVVDGAIKNPAWRQRLWETLTAEGRNIECVGTIESFGKPWMLCTKHDNISGNTMVQMAARVANIISTCMPDWLLISGGTNDASGVLNMGTSLGNLLATIYAARPIQRVLVGTIPPSAITYNNNRITPFNSTQIAAQVAIARAYGLDVQRVDAAAGITLSDLVDGTHPGNSGFVKMAANWHTALVAAMGARPFVHQSEAGMVMSGRVILGKLDGGGLLTVPASVTNAAGTIEIHDGAPVSVRVGSRTGRRFTSADGRRSFVICEIANLTFNGVPHAVATGWFRTPTRTGAEPPSSYSRLFHVLWLDRFESQDWPAWIPTVEYADGNLIMPRLATTISLAESAAINTAWPATAGWTCPGGKCIGEYVT